jgi:MFS family permease
VTAPAAPAGRLARARIAAVYVGGLLGPFGGGVVSPMLPQVGASLHASSSTVAASITLYFVPFAVVQLVSGTLGERWGRRRTVRIAYLVYVLGSLGCAFAPNLAVFLTMRAVLGTANAFTSPLLLAGLAAMVPQQRLSRAVGIYSSCQSAGQSFAPLVGGLATVVSWRWAFVVVAVVGAVLAFAPPPGRPRPGAAAPSWRPLLRVRMGWLSLAALVSYLGASALPFLVALDAEERLGLPAALTGVALLGYGLAGLLLGAAFGSLTDRFGGRLCGALAAVFTAVLVALVGVSDSVWLLTACWTLAGAGASLLTVALQNLTVRAVPGNRGGALSAVSAFRFSGAAIAPPLWLPLYQAGAALGFAAAGASLLLAVPAMAFFRPDPAARAEPEPAEPDRA